jgi:hypothetical protein
VFTDCVVTSAWWVNSSQIQRREGGYDVRGKKNYLPPAMLVLGYGILWTTEDEETMERHARPLLATSEENTNILPSAEDEEEQGDNVQDAGSESDDASNDVKNEDKYNLDQYGSASEDNEGEEIKTEVSQSVQPTTKRYLSAKQRRNLKKGKPIQDDSDEESEIDEVTTSVSEMSIKTPKQTPNVRGKKGKMKKIKAKYAEQSDEERELARKLLGAKSTVRKNEDIPSSTVDNKSTPPIKKPVPIPRPPKPIIDEPLEVFPLPQSVS